MVPWSERTFFRGQAGTLWLFLLCAPTLHRNPAPLLPPLKRDHLDFSSWPLRKPDPTCARLDSWPDGFGPNGERKERAILKALQGRKGKPLCFGGYPMLEVVVDRLLAQRPFTMVRYNDGESLAMQDFDMYDGDWMCRNCDSLPCPRRMVSSLMAALKDRRVLELAPPRDMRYIVQMSLYWENVFGPDGDLARFSPELAVWQDDFVHIASRDAPALHERIYAAVHRYKVTLLGPCPLRRLCGKIRYDSFIEIPSQHCDPADGERTLDRLKSTLTAMAANETSPRVFLVSASMLTKALGYELLESLLDKHFFIDVGSSLDLFLDGVPGEQETARRVRGEQLEAIREEYNNPNASLAALVQAGLYSSTEEARRALRAWLVLSGGRECYRECEFGRDRCPTPSPEGSI